MVIFFLLLILSSNSSAWAVPVRAFGLEFVGGNLPGLGWQILELRGEVVVGVAAVLELMLLAHLVIKVGRGTGDGVILQGISSWYLKWPYMLRYI